MSLDPALQRSVGADMERIFGPADTLIVARDLEDAPWASQALVLRRPRRRLLRRLALAALVIVVLALGLAVAHHGVRKTTFPTASHSALSALVPAPAPLRVQQPLPVSAPVSAPVTAALSVRPAPATEQADTSSGKQSRVEVPPKKQESLAVGTRSSPPRVKSSAAHFAKEPVAAKLRVRPDREQAAVSQPSTRQAEGACARGEASDACIYQDVVAADRRLRDAYADAVRDGAPVRSLAGIRSSWRKASDLSLREPDEAIRRFDRLADELRRLDGAAPR